MPKHAFFESAVHHFLLQTKRIAEIERLFSPQDYRTWKRFVLSLTFKDVGMSDIRVSWKYPKTGSLTFSTKTVQYYVRGDTAPQAKVHSDGDQIKIHNDTFYFRTAQWVIRKAGLSISYGNTIGSMYDTRSLKRFYDEERLSDNWVETVDVRSISVKQMNESCTAPEMRKITALLGDLKGKSLMDIGCGLGEASVYFAMKGARVTATDISSAMIETTQKLARANHVTIRTRQSSIENLQLPKNKQFDVVYVGNLFHHVNIHKALDNISPHIKPDGTLVSWEPVYYNPVINVYRKLVTRVRSKDERPLKLSDIAIFRDYFRNVEIKWFWLSTLVIFLIMAFIQGRDPNKERFWKSVVREGNRWAWVYNPLEQLDRVILSLLPFLGPLCWNVLIIGKLPKRIKP